jgi:hypothetical protein
MMIELDGAAGLVRKRAQNRAERDRLAGEAAILRAGAHPGVVQLLDTVGQGEPEALVLRYVAGATLCERSPMGAAEIARLGAALATTLADLHDIGIAHLSLNPSHVLIDEGGRPILCGFGEAKRATRSGDVDVWRRHDLMAVAKLLLEVAGDLPGPRAASALRSAAAGRRSRWRGVGDARSLARLLAATVPGEGSAGAARPVGARRRRSRPLIVGAAALSAVAVCWGLLAHRSGVASAGGSLSPGAASPPTCPAEDAGCRPLTVRDGIVEGRYRLRGAGGEIVLGRWDCGRQSTPAVLDFKTGRVWLFDTWPAGEPSIARLAGTVSDASGLTVLPAAERSPCDRLEVHRREAPPVVLAPVPR